MLDLSTKETLSPTHLLIPKGSTDVVLVTGSVEDYQAYIDEVYRDQGIRPPKVIDGNLLKDDLLATITKDLRLKKIHVGDLKQLPFKSGVDPTGTMMDMPIESIGDQEVKRDAMSVIDGGNSDTGVDLDSVVDNTVYIHKGELDEGMYDTGIEFYLGLESYGNVLKATLETQNKTVREGKLTKGKKVVVTTTRPPILDLTYLTPSNETHGPNVLTELYQSDKGGTFYGTDGVNEFTLSGSINQDTINARMPPSMTADGTITGDITNPGDLEHDLMAKQLESIPIIVDRDTYGEVKSLVPNVTLGDDGMPTNATEVVDANLGVGVEAYDKPTTLTHYLVPIEYIL